MNPDLLYPRAGDAQLVYLKNAVTNPNIVVGDYTIYHDLLGDPRDFEKKNVLYQYPCNGDKLIIGKYTSIACGARFLMTSGNHTRRSLSNYTFPIYPSEWPIEGVPVTEAWDNKGDIVVGSDVWIGFEALILSGVHIGDGAVIGARAVVTKDVAPYTVVAGSPAKPIRKRYDEETVQRLMALRWRDKPDEWVARHVKDIMRSDLNALAD